MTKSTATAAVPAAKINTLVPGVHRESCDRPSCTGCAPVHLTAPVPATANEESTMITVQTLPESIVTDLIDGTSESYANAEPKIKSAVRSAIEKMIKDALRTRDFADAATAQDALDLAVASKITKTAESVDYTALLADKIHSFQVAASLLADLGSPEGTEVDMDRLATLLADRPSSSATLAGITLAESVRLSRTRSESRVDLQAHVTQALAILDRPSGTFLKISEIAKVHTEAAPEGLPSQGALAARLFPSSGTCTLTGVVPADATATAPKGLLVA